MCKQFPNCSHQGPLLPYNEKDTRHCMAGANRLACKYLPACLGCTFKAEATVIAQAITVMMPKRKPGPKPIIIRKDYRESERK